MPLAFTEASRVIRDRNSSNAELEQAINSLVDIGARERANAHVSLNMIFTMQEMLNDAIFKKQALTCRSGSPLKMSVIRNEAGYTDERTGPNGLPNTWLRKYLDALDDESRELREELLWKWWSKDKLDMQNIRVELIDILHFWVSMCICAGMAPEDVFSVYQQKIQKNHDRQESGYCAATKTEDDNRSIKA